MSKGERLKEEAKSEGWLVIGRIEDEKIASQRKLADLLLVISGEERRRTFT